MMIAVEFEPIDGLAPGATAGAVATACHSRDLIILTTGPYDTMRFIAPLNISQEDLAKGANIFVDACEEVYKTKKALL